MSSAATHDPATCECDGCLASYLEAHRRASFPESGWYCLTMLAAAAKWAAVAMDEEHRDAVRYLAPPSIQDEPEVVLCPHCSGNACRACAYTGEFYEGADDDRIEFEIERAERREWGE